VSANITTHYLPGNITLNDGDIFNHGLHRNSLSSLAMNVTCTGRYDNKNQQDDREVHTRIHVAGYIVWMLKLKKNTEQSHVSLV